MRRPGGENSHFSCLLVPWRRYLGFPEFTLVAVEHEDQPDMGKFAQVVQGVLHIRSLPPKPFSVESKDAQRILINCCLSRCTVLGPGFNCEQKYVELAAYVFWDYNISCVCTMYAALMSTSPMKVSSNI